MVFNGMVKFVFDFGRWRVLKTDFNVGVVEYPNNVNFYERGVMKAREHNKKVLFVFGNFIEMPRRGTFCKRPHKLMAGML